MYTIEQLMYSHQEDHSWWLSADHTWYSRARIQKKK